MPTIIFISNSDLFFIPALVLKQHFPVQVWHINGTDPTLAAKKAGFFQQTQIANQFFETSQSLISEIPTVTDTIFFMLGFPTKIPTTKIGKNLANFYNIHFGLLPNYKGPSPVFWQLKENQAHIGLCIHSVTDKLDSGPVVWEKQIENQLFYNYQVVHQLLAQTAIEGILMLAQAYNQKQPIKIIPNTNRINRYLKKPAAKDIIIEWKSMDADTVAALVRACNPWNKGAICLFKQQQLNILSCNTTYLQNVVIEPGKFVEIDKQIFAGCANNTSVQIEAIYWQESFWGTNAMIAARLF